MGQIEKLLVPDKRLVYPEIHELFETPYDKIPLNIVSIDKEAFVDLPNLKILHLSFVKILDIDLEYMINLKELCLEIYSASLESYSVKKTLMLPANLEKLSIITIPIRLESLTNLTNLITLELEYIEDLIIADSNPFASLRKLKQLSIKYSHLVFQETDSTKNRIEFGSEEIEDLTLYSNTYKFDQSSRSKSDLEPMICFNNVPNLKKLILSIYFLSSTKESSIDIVSFQKLPNLECLEFHLNKSSIWCEEVMKGLLDNSKKLKTIKLKSVSGIDESFFSNLVNLETIEFSDCYFIPNYMKAGFSCNTLSNLSKLTHLDLCSSFRLKSLDVSLFKYIQNLKSFAVSGLEKINAGTFIYLNKLKKLKLENCGLVEISGYTFQGLNSLEELSLSFNKLEYIEAGSFDYVTTLKRLDISNLKYIF